MLPISLGFRIPISECDFSFVRSSGPGGQNVNKVNSKAVLRWNLIQSSSLYEPIRSRIIEKLSAKLTREGELIITCDTSRDQAKNKAECLVKLQELLREAVAIPRARKKSKPTYSSQRRAEDSKKHHSNKKQSRRTSRDFD